MGVIRFAGRNSSDLAVVVEYYPDYPAPARKQERVSVPGRNGDLLFAQAAYDNYTQIYDVYLSAERPRLPRVAAAVADWLLSPSGYQRLEDTYMPEVYRMAAFAGPLDITNIFNRFGRAKLEFDCKPQKWLKTGERPINITASGQLLHNPGQPALPLITVYGTGAGTITAGGVTVQIKSLDGSLTLDCDLQDAYKGTQNKNSTISAPEFPTLPPGDSAVTWTGGITRAEVVPRWWIL